MGNLCNSKKGHESYIFDVLAAKDPCSLRELVSALNVASKEVQITVSAHLINKDSKIFKCFLNKICIRLQSIRNEKVAKKKKAEAKERVTWFENKFKNWVAMQETVKPLIQNITKSWVDDFYPLEVWKWHKLSALYLSNFWKENFAGMPGYKEEVPEIIRNAVRDMAKAVCLDFHTKLRAKFEASCYDMNVAGETPLITAVKEWDDFDKKNTKELYDEDKELEWKNAVHLFIYLLSQLGCIENPDTDKDATDQFGWTCLIWAAALGSYEICEILLMTTADLEFADPCGRTALLLATENNHPTIVKLLLEQKANIDHKDKFGRTALDHAVSSNNTEVMELLGCDPEKLLLAQASGKTSKWFSKNNKTIPITKVVKEAKEP